MGMAIFRDFPAVENLEPVALEELGSAPGFKGHHLTIDLADSLAAKMVKIAVHQLSGIGHPLGLGKHIEMKMGAAAGSRRNLLPRITENPADKVTGGAVVERVFRHTAGKQREVIEEVEELLTKWAVGAQEVAFDDAFLFQNERGLRLDIRVVAGQVIGKKLAVFKDGVNRLTQKTGFAAEEANCLTITGFVTPDNNRGGRSGLKEG